MSDVILKRFVDLQRKINERDMEKGVPGLNNTIRSFESQGKEGLISLFTDLPAHSSEVE